MLSGKSDVAILFDPAARLTMDNLSSGSGTSHGILIKGAASNVRIVNPTIVWSTAPSSRSFGDGIRVMGYPSDSAPAGGWLGSTGTVSNVTIANANITNAPQAGAVLHGVSDAHIHGFRATSTKADGLHFNACRRINVAGHTANNCGDDGLAFVTYYHATNIWDDTTAGPFNQPSLTEWSNTGAATAITVAGGIANGVRVQGGKDLTISSVMVSGKGASGIVVNSAIIGGAIAWSGLASRNVSISGAVINACDSGITIQTQNITTASTETYWDFGLSITDVTIRDCTNWSIYTGGDGSSSSVVSGLTLRNIAIKSGTGGGGNGGCNFTSLRSTILDGIRQTSTTDSQILIGGADAMRTGTLKTLPRQALVIGSIVNNGGRILVQDIAGWSAQTLESIGASGEGVILNRVARATVTNINSILPARGSSLARGVLITQSWDVDVVAVKVSNDSHIGSSFSCIEVGGGDATNVAAVGLRIEKVVYTDDRNVATTDVGVQGGSYAPIQWSMRLNYRHEGVTTPVWTAATFP